MARFARIDSQIRANGLILANHFRVLELSLESRAFGGLNNCESQVSGDSRESLARYENRDFSANRFARINSDSRRCESLDHLSSLLSDL